MTPYLTQCPELEAAWRDICSKMTRGDFTPIVPPDPLMVVMDEIERLNHQMKARIYVLDHLDKTSP